jgi:hypothetical protein
MTIKAIYRDVADPNNQFSGVVMRTADGWRIQTDEHGPRKIDYYIREKDAVGGLIEFVDYEIYPEQNLRPADIIPFINSVRARLPWPTKPSNPPVQSEPEERLHVERRPGESNLAALQRVYGEKETAARRKARQQMREQAQSATVDPRTAHQAQQARQERNEFAALKKR